MFMKRRSVIILLIFAIVSIFMLLLINMLMLSNNLLLFEDYSFKFISKELWLG